MGNEKGNSRGRKPKISHEKVFEELKSVVEYLFDVKGNLIPYSDKIWLQLSNNLDGKILPHNLYNSVSQNRNLLKTNLKSLLSRQSIENDHIFHSESDQNEDFCSETENNSDVSEDDNIYNFDIPYREYLKMSPIQITYGKKKNAKTYTVLKQGVWTNIINDWFIRLCKVPCNIIYKRCRVSNDTSRSKNFLKFVGRCKDCGARATGWATEKPAEAMPLVINICLTGLNRECDHVSKRPLNAQKRSEVGQKLLHDCASNWIRNGVSPLKFGNKLPVNIYSKNVLRKCKQEERDKKLGVTIKCPIMSLIEFKYSSFAGSIHFVCADPFIVHYWSPCQLVVYKQLRKSYARLAIDATGGIVKKLKRTKEGILSNHIFLYEAVISDENYQVSVAQMVSERQDTFTIYSWLMMWLNHGVSIPQETVTDYSMALLGAISRAFCGGLTLREYVDSCIKVLDGKQQSKLTCFIRIDIAHLVKLVTRWSCWKKTGIPHLKDFYVRCTVLLINSKNLDNFKEILTDILILAMSQYCGKLIESPDIDCPSKVAKKRLLSKVKGISDIPNQNYSDQKISENSEDIDELEEDLDQNSNSYIIQFLNEIELRSISKSSMQSEDLNAYFLPLFAKNILRISKQFPLWSNVMTSFFLSPYSTATSASVEGDFAELKHKILRHDFKPMTADRFVITHLQNLKSSMTIARSHQLFSKESESVFKVNNSQERTPGAISVVNKHFENSNSFMNLSPSHSEVQLSRSDECQNSTSSLCDFGLDKNVEKDTNFMRLKSELIETLDTTECNEISQNEILKCDARCFSKSPSTSDKSVDTLVEEEQWMGYKSEPTGPFKPKGTKRKRQTKYIDPCKEIDRILHNSRMRSYKNTLLLNGNISTQCKIKYNSYIVTNTCAFDSITFAVAVAYNDCLSYQQFINKSQNQFLLFSKHLAMQGSNKLLYKRRVELLKLHFEEIELFTKVRTINAECNVTKIIQSYFKDEPSAKEHICCENCGEITVRFSPTIILPLNSKFEYLQQLINAYTETKYTLCSTCDGIKTSSRMFSEHIFIETDIFTSTIELNNIPKMLNEKFLLTAIIDFVSESHYVTYIYRAHKNVWELHNDLVKKISVLKTDNILLHPHMLMYVKIQN